MPGILADFTSCLLFRRRGAGVQYLLLRRADGRPYSGIWQYVTGTLEEGEHTLTAVLREVREETGLEPEKLYRFPDTARFYLPEDDNIHIATVFIAEVPYREQVIISDEHSQYRWVNKQTGMKMLCWPFDRFVVKLSDKIIRDCSQDNPYIIKDIAGFKNI